jgi:protein gp37
VWMGVSVENQYWVNRRIPCLTQVPAAIRFLSCEPLLKPVDLRRQLQGIHWVIVGGESGPHARPTELCWIRDIRDQCHQAGVAFFLKQLGGHPTPRGHDDALLDGKLWRDMPVPRGLVESGKH